jgi:hypothetical protein
MTPLAVFVSLLFLFSLVSRRLDQTIVTAPIVFTVAECSCFPPCQRSLNLELMRAFYPGSPKSA